MRTPKSTKVNTAIGTGTIAPGMREAKPAVVSSIRLYGPRQIGGSVLFTASYPQASSVQIAGDFNNWQPDKNPMKKNSEGAWQTSIVLSKGLYKYRFVVDGRWQHDPHNDMTEPNPFGELNSVIKVA